MREFRTSGSAGGQHDATARRILNGHEGGNAGYSQGRAYIVAECSLSRLGLNAYSGSASG